MASKSHIRGQARVGAAFGATLGRFREVVNPPVPTIVISRGRRDLAEPWTTTEREHDWRYGHESLLDGVPDGHLWVAEQSGHMIQLEQPEIVRDAVRVILEGG